MPAIDSFIDIRMPERICQEFQGGPIWATTMMRSRMGFVQANADRPDVLFSYESTSFTKDSTLRLQLLAFNMAVMGMANTFRFRDIGHYWSGCIPPGVGDITPLAAADILPFATGDGTTTVFQVKVPYVIGPVTTWRKITKPCTWGAGDTYNDNPGYTGPRFWKGTTPVAGAGFTLDPTTGIVTFAVAPTNGQAIRCALLFDIHGRFGSDQMMMQLMDSPELGQVKIAVLEELEA